MNTAMPLTEAQRATICEVLALGCDRTTACSYAGAEVAQLDAATVRDDAFRRRVVRAEAQAVLRHMGNVHKAAQDEKNWRTSAWWLERWAESQAPVRGRGGAHAQLVELVGRVAQAIVAEVPDVSVQRRIIERLRRLLAGAEGAREPVVLEGLMLSAPTSTETGPSQEAQL